MPQVPPVPPPNLRKTQATPTPSLIPPAIQPFALVELIVLANRQDQPKLRRLGDDWFHTKVIHLDRGATTAPAA